MIFKKEFSERDKFCSHCGEPASYNETKDNLILDIKNKKSKLSILYILLCIIDILCFNPFSKEYISINIDVSQYFYDNTWFRTIKKYGRDDFKSDKYIEYYINEERTCVYEREHDNILGGADKSDCDYYISISVLNEDNLPYYGFLQSAYIHFHPGADEYQKSVESSNYSLFSILNSDIIEILLFIVIVVCVIKLFKTNRKVAITGILAVVLSKLLFYIFMIVAIIFGFSSYF